MVLDPWCCKTTQAVLGMHGVGSSKSGSGNLSDVPIPNTVYTLHTLWAPFCHTFILSCFPSGAGFFSLAAINTRNLSLASTCNEHQVCFVGLRLVDNVDNMEPILHVFNLAKRHCTNSVSNLFFVNVNEGILHQICTQPGYYQQFLNSGIYSKHELKYIS